MRLRHIHQDTTRPSKILPHTASDAHFSNKLAVLVWPHTRRNGGLDWSGVLTSGFIPLWLNSYLYKSNLTSPATQYVAIQRI